MADTPTTDAKPTLGKLLRDAWQLPLLLVALTGIVGALWYSRAHKAANEWNATLEQASEQISKDELAIARTILEEVIAPHLPDAPAGFEATFDAVRADLAAAEVLKAQGAKPEQFDAVAKMYEGAIAKKAELSEAQLAQLARMLEGAGRAGDAVAAAERSGDAERAQRLASRFGRDALQRAYDAAMSSSSGRASDDAGARREADAFFKEYEDFRAAPRIMAADRAWAAALAARVRHAIGHAAAATERLQLEMRRLEAADADGDHVDPVQFAELGYLLGEGFRQQDLLADAERELVRAREMSDPSSRLGGEISLALGRTLAALNRHDEANDVFDRAVLAEHGEELKPDLVLGRARTRAKLGHDDTALRDIDALLGLAEKRRLSARTARELLASLNDLARGSIDAQRFDVAVEYATRASEVEDSGAGHANALIALGEASYRQARLVRDTETERAGGPAKLDPGIRAEINRHFKRAAESYAAFLRMEESKALSALERAEMAFTSGDGFDCAGEPSAALSQFEYSLSQLPVGDSKRTERLIRIGDIHAHAGEFDKARDAYEGVYKITHNDPRVALPLCKVLIGAGDETRARAELQRIIEGSAGLRPDSEQYREALDLFARLSFARGDFGASAERLGELVERDPSSGSLGERCFRLGQSLQELSRLASEESRRDDLTSARRQQLERTARDRAFEAQRAYQRTIEALESRMQSLDGLGHDMLRNAYLQRAHCAFDRGQFKEAIDFYETIDRKYPDEAASVLALVQVVNAADALGDTPRAEAAHTRALRRIESLPDDALLGEGGVFSRDDWRSWLRNHPPGSRRVANAGQPAKESHP